jgi:hypothetical protein
MNWLDFFNHIANLLLPAAGVALILGLLAALQCRRALWSGWCLRLMAINCAAGVLVLVAGLFINGGDGHMLTYAALVLAMGSCHACLTHRA